MTRTRTLARRSSLMVAMAGAVAFGAVALAPAASAADAPSTVDGSYTTIDGPNENGPDAFLLDGTGRKPIFFCEVTPQEVAVAQAVAAAAQQTADEAELVADQARAAADDAKRAREAADKIKAPKVIRAALEDAEKIAKKAADDAEKAAKEADEAADKAAKAVKDLEKKANKRHNNCQADPFAGGDRF
jgi:hypothetical protein